MFRSARIKLTAWYLLTIMLISIVLSLAVYHSSTFEIRRGLYRAAMQDNAGRLHLQLPHGSTPPPRPVPNSLFAGPFPPPPPGFNEQLFAEQKQRVAMQLGVLNLGILGLAGLAGYLLSGRTLKPIEEMLDEQKRFVSDASHELRTPLTAMRTETEVALLCNKLDPADAKEVLESNLEEIGKLQLLADNLLTLGKYEAATYKLNVANVDLAEVFEDALERVRPMAQARNIELESSINSSIVLHADKEPLTRMFVIFLDNAIKYGLENSKVIMSAHTLKNKAVISIQDFGIGIFADDLPHIFNRFYRVDTARTKTGATGYGLGLSIAKDIIDLHHGNVAVTSTPDEGTTFTVTLPHVFS